MVHSRKSGGGGGGKAWSIWRRVGGGIFGHSIDRRAWDRQPAEAAQVTAQAFEQCTVPLPQI